MANDQKNEQPKRTPNETQDPGATPRPGGQGGDGKPAQAQQGAPRPNNAGQAGKPASRPGEGQPRNDGSRNDAPRGWRAQRRGADRFHPDGCGPHGLRVRPTRLASPRPRPSPSLQARRSREVRAMPGEGPARRDRAARAFPAAGPGTRKGNRTNHSTNACLTRRRRTQSSRAAGRRQAGPDQEGRGRAARARSAAKAASAARAAMGARAAGTAAREVRAAVLHRGGQAVGTSVPQPRVAVHLIAADRRARLRAPPARRKADARVAARSGRRGVSVGVARPCRPARRSRRRR